MTFIINAQYFIRINPQLFFTFHLVPPLSIQILDESESQIKNGTTIGPLREGQHFSSTCVVRGARPAPLVGWYRAGNRLKGNLLTNTCLII